VSRGVERCNPEHDTCEATVPPRSSAALLLRGRGAVGADSYGATRAAGSEYGE